MNKVILIGRLTKDPKLKTTASGIASTNFSVAVQRNFTNHNGEREADFINCVAWRKQAENIAKYCNKGSQVAVDGRIQVRSYDGQDGTKKYVTEVVADNVTFLGSKNNNSGNDYTPNTSESDIVTTDVSEDPFKDFGSEEVLSDDDLPF